MITAMREYFRGMKLILLIVGVAFVATSLVFYGSTSLRGESGRASAQVASVNGEDIPPGRFQRVLRNYLEYYRRTYQQNLTPEMAERVGLTQQVINELIQEALILQQAKREGITVSDEELRLRIQAIPAFQEDGRFSLDRYKLVLKENRMDPNDFESEVRRDMLRQRMEALVKDGIKVSDAEVEQAYGIRYERVRAEWAYVEAAPLMAQVTVSDADAEAFLKTHEARFSRPERRKIQYALLRVKAGEDFGKLAKEISEDTATAGQGGELGFVGKGEMVPQFEEGVFALKKGEVSPQPVRTPFGYHAIKVLDVQDAGVQPFREVAPKIKEKLGAERSERAAQAKADEARPALAAGKDFASDAKQLGLDVKETTIARGDGLEGIGRDPGLEDALFGLAVGGVTPPIKTAVGIMIARVTEQFAAGVPPFAEVKDRVVEAIKRERAQAAAEERAKALGASVGAGDLLAAARRDKLPGGETPLFSRAEPPKEREALPGAVLLAALQTPAGKVSEPVKTATGVYIVQTLERRAADPQGFDKSRDQLRTQVLDQKRAFAWERWVKALYAGAKIKVQGETVGVN